MSTFFENTKKLVNEAAKIAQIPEDVLARLQKPDKILEFEIAVHPVRSQTPQASAVSLSAERTSNGVKKFQGWRVQHNNILGPYKGGIRFYPDSSLDEVEALASLMTWKTSLAGLPYGGGKGAVRVDPKKLNSQELEELSRGYVRAIWQEIGPQKDVPAPDVGTTPEVLDWMVDEYAKLVGHPEPATFTGKSIAKGGSQGREVATGFGGFVILREFLKLGSKFLVLSSKSQPTVAIQGFGNVGSNLAEILVNPVRSQTPQASADAQSHRTSNGVNNGFSVVAISNSRQAFYNEDGVDIAEALKSPKEFSTLGKQISNQELLELPVDILVPAALENQITSENAPKIKAKIILEMANGPVAPEADEILNKRGVEIIPDILANSGGVTGSYFEWKQNLENKQWSEEEVLQKIDDKLTEAFAAVLETKNKYKVTWRVASYIRAITRVAEAMTKVG